MLDASASLILLKGAVKVLFGEREPPKDRLERCNLMKQFPEDKNEARPAWVTELENIDDQYYEDPDNLSERLTTYAEATGLLLPFKVN